MMKPTIRNFLIYVVLALILAGCNTALIPSSPAATRPGIEGTISRDLRAP